MNKIVEIARSYIGQEEISGNKGFIDKAFDKEMRNIGFYTGAAWCGFFCMLSWLKAKEPIHVTDKRKQVSRIVTSSAVRSMKQASMAGRFELYPVPGAVAVWRTFKNNKPQSTGHMAIVDEDFEIKKWHEDKENDLRIPVDGYFKTIEGNTNADGGREGKEVAEKSRSFSWTRADGLRLMGFIHPVENV